MRRDRTFDYSVRKDRDAARGQFPHPAVMNVGTGRFHDALDALDAKDDLLRRAEALLVSPNREAIETWRRDAGLVTPYKSKIDHDALDRPENIWKDERSMRVAEWWTESFYRGTQGEDTLTAFKRLLGRQDTTITFRTRNWVWHRPKEGWTLYVNSRGPALHVRRDASPEEAWAAFEKFRDRIDRLLVGGW